MIEDEITGGEYDHCFNCGDGGDNCNLHKIKKSTSFICESCKEEYEDSLLFVRKVHRQLISEVY